MPSALSIFSIFFRTVFSRRLRFDRTRLFFLGSTYLREFCRSIFNLRAGVPIALERRYVHMSLSAFGQPIWARCCAISAFFVHLRKPVQRGFYGFVYPLKMITYFRETARVEELSNLVQYLDYTRYSTGGIVFQTLCTLLRYFPPFRTCKAAAGVF